MLQQLQNIRIARDPRDSQKARALITHGGLEQIPHRARVAELFVACGGQVLADGPVEVVMAERTIGSGMPDVHRITTSHVESQNLTLRIRCRRLTRLTNAFSKKFENFRAAVALNFVYYNFCKTHSAIRMTPAQADHVENSAWTVAEPVERCGE